MDKVNNKKNVKSFLLFIELVKAIRNELKAKRIDLKTSLEFLEKAKQSFTKELK